VEGFITFFTLLNSVNYDLSLFLLNEELYKNLLLRFSLKIFVMPVKLEDKLYFLVSTILESDYSILSSVSS